jgi:hypothetical protein
MGDHATVSTAARQLSHSRWGAQRPLKLARELLPRLAELPAAERQKLRQALEAAELGGTA